MRAVFASVVACLLLFSAACAQKVNDPADVQAIKKSIEDYVKAVNSSDAAGIAALMTDKTVYADLNLPVAVGGKAIQALNQAFFDQARPEINIPVEEVRVVGDLAVARGTWTLKITPKGEGVATVNDGGSWIAVFGRQGDGSWKWDWVVPNSNQPLPGSTAGGEDEQALYQLERDWVAADLKRDASAVDKFLADDFISNFDGKIRNKKQLLAEMKTSPTKIEAATNSDMQAMVFGDTAFVRGIYSEKSTTGGKDSSMKWRYTEVYAKRNGRWQCITQYVAKAQ